MKVHHLNCGTMKMPGGRMVCHVLLVETDSGLVLVDSGFGMDDIRDPKGRMGSARFIARPALDTEETAVRQVERLGFGRDDVRHIIVTHFDGDHIGGLSDFPAAQVHVTAAEALGAMHAPSRQERNRFHPALWAHGPKFVEHNPDGEKWRGFAAAKELDAIAPGIVLISLPGHTRGHAAVAVDAGDRWILHAGDAFYHRGTLDGQTRIPAPVRLMENFVAYDLKKLRDNQARLAALHRKSEPDLVIVNAHDAVLYERMLAGA
ncbi:MBL fold metallo-hydrolase [Streptomyces ipomoeae]|uniref:MBL fold metallo-hydrolase n=1 Tax=Streptomyces ipomoeae TaxID=103232 RepID=UPI00114671F6|nr:MBL fold metallo-hydrolase [Streptomyces ipomoeae]MDX2939768.1 MBL fold metallo-hydrolase [Streptomyces ipomoeae]TQE15667.1 MBL fold metallo-hydrolase [Streptomyces ipomoeae]